MKLKQKIGSELAAVIEEALSRAEMAGNSYDILKASMKTLTEVLRIIDEDE